MKSALLTVGIVALGVFVGSGCGSSKKPLPVDAAEDLALPPDAEIDAEPQGKGQQDNDKDGYLTPLDCNDADFDVHPGATEVCNAKDDNCDGQIDEDATDAKTWYADADGDSHGDAANSKKACSAPAGYVDNSNDCDDTNADAHPGATEVCNGADDNCDGEVDEPGAVGSTPYYPDTDTDGHGAKVGVVNACKKPAGFVASNDDCNDTDKAVSPDGVESCNGKDDNCDGATDENGAVGAVAYYPDVDKDGYGAASATAGQIIMACGALANYAPNNTDCNDTDATIKPTAVDAPDPLSVDSNCDGVDGEAAKAIFVSVAVGNDINDGLGSSTGGVVTASPVKTLAKGIELADATTPKRYLLVSTGDYDQGTSSLVMKEGVSIYGGYGSTWADRSSGRSAVVVKATGSAPTVSATAITQQVILDRLTIRGPDLSALPTFGVESIAMLVVNTGSQNMVSLRDVQIDGGKGSPGTPGADAANATTGLCSCGGGSGGTPSAAATVGGCGGAAAGGNGADSMSCVCGSGPTANAYPGYPGTSGQSCSAATSGGTNSAANLKGTISGTDWTAPATGNPGATGANGGGGGGGGKGGRYQWCCDFACAHTIDHEGGNGGSGAAGGCGAAGGQPGTPGGASFGVLLVDSTVDFTTVEIRLGIGGRGGDGGDGGNGLGGATGATGAAGTSEGTCWSQGWPLGNPGYYTTTSSGAGGTGGSGGSGCGGGGGAGGHGGWVFGLARVGGIALNSAPSYNRTGSAAGLGGGAGSGGVSGNAAVTSNAGAAGTAGSMVDDQAF